MCNKRLLRILYARYLPFFVFALALNRPAFSQQELTITGTVTDSADTGPLPGVSVLVSGTTNGVQTNASGKFTINAAGNATLIFRYIGYREKLVAVNNQTTINVSLTASNLGLDEVVVVGYGTQKKVSVIGAISTIQTKEVKQSPSANLSVSLAGRLPGLTAIQRTGEPGLNAINLFIRGRGTVNIQQPLLLVDGVERSIDALDPNEIESVSILKDATATAIYGVRGANGVILVTTRRGVADKPEITLSTEYGLSDFTRFPKALDAFNFASVSNQIQLSDGVPATDLKYSQEDLDHYRLKDRPEQYPDHNWYQEFTKNFAPQQRYNLNISGGTDKARYFISASALDQGGQWKTDQTEWDANTNLNRYNFRSNVDVNLNKTLKASLTAAGYLEKQNRPAGVVGFPISASLLIVNAMVAVPSNAYNILTPAGEVLSFPGSPGGQPVYGLINRSGFIQEDRNNINASFNMEQQLDVITKGLSAKVQFSFDSRGINTQRRERNYARYRLQVDQQSDGTDSLSYVLFENTNTPLGANQQTFFESYSNLQASLNYARTFGDHNVSGLFLFNQDKRVIQIRLPFNLRGFAGRGTYNYKNKYFTEVNFGYNGSEQFAKGKRYGFFPSASVGWLLSEENFMREGVPFVTSLKLRASYGLAGNDRYGDPNSDADRFLYLDNFGRGGAYSNLPQSVNEILIGNTDLTWETAKKLNIGMDANLFNSVGLVIDVFDEKRDNILQRRGTIPVLYGTGAFPPQNIGKVHNRGFEVELSFNKNLSKNLNLYTRLNTAYAKNTITFLDEPLLPENYAVRTRSTNFSIEEPFGLETAGYFNSNAEITSWADQSRYGQTKPGDFKYIDQNGDNIIDDADFVSLGYPNVPLLNYGFSLGVTYKSFDVSALVQGTGLVTQRIIGQAVYGNENLFDFHQGQWTPEKIANGEAVTFPRISYNSNMNRQPSSFYTQRSDFLRLKNAEIGYSLPSSVSRKIGAQRVRLYANGLNLFFLWDNTKFKQVDPEANQGGGNEYPITRIYNFGLNVTF